MISPARWPFCLLSRLSDVSFELVALSHKELFLILQNDKANLSSLCSTPKHQKVTTLHCLDIDKAKRVHAQSSFYQENGLLFCLILGTSQEICFQVHYRWMNKTSNPQSWHSQGKISSYAFMHPLHQVSGSFLGILAPGLCSPALYRCYLVFYSYLFKVLSGGYPVLCGCSFRPQGSCSSWACWACLHSSLCLIVTHSSHSKLGDIRGFMNTHPVSCTV